VDRWSQEVVTPVSSRLQTTRHVTSRRQKIHRRLSVSTNPSRGYYEQSAGVAVVGRRRPFHVAAVIELVLSRGRREDASTPRPRRRPRADPGVDRKLLTFACRCWWNCRVLPGYVLHPCCCVCCVFHLLLFAAVRFLELACHPWGQPLYPL